MDVKAVRIVLGVLTVAVLAPTCAVLGLLAALFGLQQFVNGWTPSKWFSDNGADWFFGDGTRGSAGNYLGFMVCAFGAYICGRGVAWGLNAIRSSR